MSTDVMGCEVVLFHSALGLRPAVREWADHLRAAGHRVHLPDLYDGLVFDDLESGMRHVEQAFAADVRHAEADLEWYDYPVAGHLFADPGLADFDENAAATMLTRVIQGLDRWSVAGPQS